MSTRAPLKLTTNGSTKELAINLGSLKDELPRHRNDFLYRHSLGLINDALAREYGRKTTHTRIGQLRFSNKGKTVTYRAIIQKPVHGREGVFETFNCDEAEAKPTVTTISFSLPDALATDDAAE